MKFENGDLKGDDLSKKDLLDVHRHGRWNTNFEQIYLLEFVGATDFSQVVYAKHSTSYVQSLYIRYSLEDFFKGNGFEILKCLELSHDGEYPPSFSNIEYEPDKYKSCLYLGYMFLKKGNNNYVFNIDYGHREVIFRLNGLKNADPEPQKILQDLLEYSEQNNFLHGKKIDAKCNFITFDRDYDWDDLILDKRRTREVRQNLSNIIDNREIYQKNNILLKRGLIFSGPPGTGKTLLGKILCNKIDWTFIWVTPKHLEDSRDVSKIVGMARDLHPSIIFLEDIDLYGGDRSSNGRRDILGELMNQLDGIQENRDIITIATTNQIEVLEKALLKRPGRFDKVITFAEPSKESRARMLQSFSKDLNLEDDMKFDDLVELTTKLTGAQIRELVNMAVLQAIDDHSYDENKVLTIKKAHFEAALPSVKKKDHGVGFHNSDADDDYDDDLWDAPGVRP